MSQVSKVVTETVRFYCMTCRDFMHEGPLTYSSMIPLSLLKSHLEGFYCTALPCAGKGDHPNELDLAEVQIQVNQESKETFDFDQGTRKYGHIKFSQSIGLPPRNSYLVAIQELAARACLLVFCKLLQTFLQTQSLPSRNSQPCVFRRLYKIQCIPKLPEPWFKFKKF